MPSVVALLGRRDVPTDGIEDYCTFLAEALLRNGIELKQTRVQWMEGGWIDALRQLSHESRDWRGRWVLLQYTALAWSRRGFPFWVLAVLAILRLNGTRVAVVFHEPRRQGGSRWVDRFRGRCQDWVIRRIYQRAAKSIFTVPLKSVSWLPRDEERAAYIPIGANIPQRSPQSKSPRQKTAMGTVAVFCLDGNPALRQELRDISDAVRVATKKGAQFRVVFVGRGTAEAAGEISGAFGHIPVEISNLGLLSPEKLTDTLAEADVMLCVRGRVNQCRGTAVAGIACSLPIVAYAGEVEGTPLADAGLLLVPYRDADALGVALFRVLTDSDLARELKERSAFAQQKYFSWDFIAGSYVRFLEGGSN
jgi:glycosyltransferase involved in cell wall biosynthesis